MSRRQRLAYGASPGAKSLRNASTRCLHFAHRLPFAHPIECAVIGRTPWHLRGTCVAQTLRSGDPFPMRRTLIPFPRFPRAHLSSALLALVAAASTTSCMNGPYDGDVVGGTTTGASFEFSG